MKLINIIIKRIFDFSFSGISLLLLSPLLLIIYFTISKRLGRPVIFTQVRPGLFGKNFEITKFRSMTKEKDDLGNLKSDSDRLTPFGVLLRSSSLDELPGLWCVLKGEMSLVGPRPLLVEYLPLYSSEQTRRHHVKPGITGWAQINGRNAISWEQKFQLDVWYVDNQSFWLDIKILLLTVKKVFARSDINAAGEATMAKFTGDNS
jgi:lipopolysaccharide/colanic/teichoic acid biosynthesis glycosyltransferase